MFKAIIIGLSLLSTVSFAAPPRPGKTVIKSYHCGSIANEKGMVVKGVAYVIECQFRLKNVVSCQTFKQSIRPGAQKGTPIALNLIEQDEEMAMVASEEARIYSTIYKTEKSAEIILEKSKLSGLCEAI